MRLRKVGRLLDVLKRQLEALVSFVLLLLQLVVDVLRKGSSFLGGISKCNEVLVHLERLYGEDTVLVASEPVLSRYQQINLLSQLREVLLP